MCSPEEWGFLGLGIWQLNIINSVSQNIPQKVLSGLENVFQGANQLFGRRVSDRQGHIMLKNSVWAPHVWMAYCSGVCLGNESPLN